MGRGSGAGNGGVRVPNMPLFELPQELIQQMNAEGDSGLIGEGQKHFSFPADESFWDNFVAQVHLSDAANEEPLFSVTASHDPRVQSVNQVWMRQFVGAWERQNPHTVTVTTPEGMKSFYASDDFWKNVVCGLDVGDQDVRDDDIWISTNNQPGGQMLRARRAAWEDACSNWERANQCTDADKERKLARWTQEGVFAEARRAEERQARERQAQLGDGPLICPFLTLGTDFDRDPGLTPLELDDEGFDFPSDDNFWKTLKRLSRLIPGALAPPTFTVDAGDGMSLVVGRDFLRNFLAAWQRDYPLVITVALRNNDRVMSTVFNANLSVWEEFLSRASGRADPSMLQHIPEGVCLANSSTDEAAGMRPVELTVAAYLELCALWPDLDATESSYGSVGSRSWGTESGARQQRPRAPCVRLPKPDGTQSKERRKREPLPPGAVPRKERAGEAPTVTLHLHQGILDGIAAARRARIAERAGRGYHDPGRPLAPGRAVHRGTDPLDRL